MLWKNKFSQKKCVGGAEKVIKIDGVIIVDEIVYPIEKKYKIQQNPIEKLFAVLKLNGLWCDTV